MKRFRSLSLCLIGLAVSLVLPLAQNLPPNRTSASVVPPLVNFSGRALDTQGKAVSGTVGLTFAIYKEQYDGPPLWLETQNVQADARGNYTVQLGTTKSEGLPLSLFSSGAAHWLGVTVNGEAELPRVLLLSVPYALKAADAQTLGGLPPSAFVLAGPTPAPASTSATAVANTPEPTVGGSGTPGFLPIWADSSNLANSMVFQSGTGPGARLGVNLTKPLATLDVNGQTLIRGTLEPITKGIATPVKAFNSNALDFEASSFNSQTGQAVMQHFEWQAEPTGNNTNTPGATLNLLFAQGNGTPVETGVKLSNTGVFTFASGQPFPGTIASVTAGTDLTGGGNSGNVTLNLDTTKVPQLSTANTFAATQTISTGDLTLGSGAVNLSQSTDATHGVIRQTGNPLIHTCCGGGNNVFLGLLAGNFSLTGGENIGIGRDALQSITSGDFNTALGVEALSQTTTASNNVGIGGDSLLVNTTGGFNVAVGTSALSKNVSGTGNTAVGEESLNGMAAGDNNTAVGDVAGQNFGKQATGSQNTFIGYATGPGAATGTLNEATAIGAHAAVSQSFTMALGGTGQDAVTVAIGTATPFSDYSLDVENSGPRIDSGIVVNAVGGNLYLGMTKGVHKFRVDTNGETFADGGYQTSGADFAESVAVRGGKSLYEPGDLLVIERGAERRLTLSHTPYSTLVAGIYSTKPGMLATPHSIEDSRVKAEVPLAIVGIVPCKVTAENGPIHEGDLLVASSRPGYAMKGTDRRRMLGAVVGKALTPLPKGTGVIEVLVTLQ